MTILHIRRLDAFFPGKQVLRQINLQVEAGRKLALVGESGSGKTVLAQALMRLNPSVALSGELIFQEQNLLDLSPSALQKLRGRDIGMVFQEPMTALNPVMPVGRQIAEVLTLHLGYDKRQAWQKTIALLQETGIQDAEEKARAYPFQLSGGQRQRAMIAMAVAAEPKLLIADEPTTALDVAVQAQILDLLARLQQERNMTLLYITHDLNLVRRFADDVAVMRHGEIVEQGSVAQIFKQPQHDYTRMLLNAAPERRASMPSENAATVLQASNVSVSVHVGQSWFKRQRKTILHPLSFQLTVGETLGIIGESGSGKTTLAKALLKLIPAEGQVTLGGQPFSSRSRRDIQMVFQDPFGAFNPRMNVLDIVSEALRVYEPQLPKDTVRSKVMAVLQSVGLPDDILSRYPHEFSGGQRQRLAIARALIVQPKVLVLDEPTSALDVQWQQEILNLLADLQQAHGLSLIIISHDLAVIRALSHHVIVLKDGQVLESGECTHVFAKPDSDYTKKLLLHHGA